VFVKLTKKGEKTMRYSKPEVVKLENAVVAVRGQDKVDPVAADNGARHKTINAYEADE
jgi:hypothetical protein